ncbi:GGDEF domain-containing protein [Colwellia sp. MB02u-14]|uniref:GGDEF domain-containing protein n=1 Tax=Colwellia sp. MB02u-14 TaxID=2759815 RepID=UPI0015F66BF8|nr:GGDEF domain-containing protein [Colwellia sp. MB02u-14]MBA6303359.1 diguanylate cyclase [Colwellia sp. MB02u-14]
MTIRLNRLITPLFIIPFLSAVLALINVVLQFSWIALSIFILTFITLSLNLQQHKQVTNHDIDSTENQPAEEHHELESKVQERTLELNIALQELEEMNKELQEKNTLDDLTGLYNRRFYDQKILAEYRRSRRNLTPLSLVVIDVDHFKKVNDKYGHLAGDECLVAVSTCIKQCLRRSADISCRYGGEEFCLILPETDSKGALAFAEELRESIANCQINYNNTIIKLTISCGISTYLQQKNVQLEHLFTAADKALYQAKNNGRNQVKQQDFAGISTT